MNDCPTISSTRHSLTDLDVAEEVVGSLGVDNLPFSGWEWRRRVRRVKHLGVVQGRGSGHVRVVVIAIVGRDTPGRVGQGTLGVAGLLVTADDGDAVQGFETL